MATPLTVVLSHTDGEIGSLTIPPDRRDPPTQAELQALGDKCGELADDVSPMGGEQTAP